MLVNVSVMTAFHFSWQRVGGVEAYHCEKSDIAGVRTITRSHLCRWIFRRYAASGARAPRVCVGRDRLECDYRAGCGARDERLHEADHALSVRDSIGGRLHDLR